MRSLKRTTKSSMDSRNPGWQGIGSADGGPSRYFMTWDGTKQRIHPFTTGITMTLGLLTRPVLMNMTTADAPDPRIPAIHHEFLPLAAAYYLLRNDGVADDLNKAEKFLNDFNAFIGGQDATG